MAAAPTSRFVLESVAELDGGTRSPELFQLGPSQIPNTNTKSKYTCVAELDGDTHSPGTRLREASF